MSRLGLLRTSIRSSLAARTSREQNHGLLPSLLREPPRRFSTEAQQPPQDSAPDRPLSHDAAVDQFVRNPSTGVVYGKLFGTTSHYNGLYTPSGMMVQFHSRGDYENAVRVINRNKVFRLERSDRQRWDFVADTDGKTVLIEGIPRTALQEDVERFLSGTAYESSSIKLFTRQGFPEPLRLATVCFPSQIQAMNAYITKNKGFILNNPVVMRVLQ
ncbi:hypothetical protein M0R45_029317 [Rubus argutus]|uniref:Uncharacterized protein n=1 Tax=Rubus argutus TaxID=59490 RepID=A0AAW1WA57_RUBAR